MKRLWNKKFMKVLINVIYKKYFNKSKGNITILLLFVKINIK